MRCFININDFIHTVCSSNARDWHLIDVALTNKRPWGKTMDDTNHPEHVYRATYKNNIQISMAYGLENDDNPGPKWNAPQKLNHLLC
jgi:hypothetical protein